MGASKNHLTIYIANHTPGAIRAIRNLRAICADLKEHTNYEIEIVDITQDPDRAESDRVLATPMVIRRLPLPIRRVIGDLSDREQVLYGLKLEQGEGEG